MPLVSTYIYMGSVFFYTTVERAKTVISTTSNRIQKVSPKECCKTSCLSPIENLTKCSTKPDTWLWKAIFLFMACNTLSAFASKRVVLVKTGGSKMCYCLESTFPSTSLFFHRKPLSAVTANLQKKLATYLGS